MPVPPGGDGHLHGDQVEDPGAVAHLPGQMAQPVNVVSAPDALQVHRAAAEGLCADFRKEGLQLRKGEQLHGFRHIRGDVGVQAALVDQIPAKLCGGLEVHIVVAAHGQVVGEIPACADVAGMAVLEGQHGGAGVTSIHTRTS